MRETAETWLRERLGAGAGFRDGQWEAIEALVKNHARVLVVERTGCCANKVQGRHCSSAHYWH